MKSQKSSFFSELFSRSESVTSSTRTLDLAYEAGSQLVRIHDGPYPVEMVKYLFKRFAEIQQNSHVNLLEIKKVSTLNELVSLTIVSESDDLYRRNRQQELDKLTITLQPVYVSNPNQTQWALIILGLIENSLIFVPSELVKNENLEAISSDDEVEDEFSDIKINTITADAFMKMTRQDSSIWILKMIKSIFYSRQLLDLKTPFDIKNLRVQLLADWLKVAEDDPLLRFTKFPSESFSKENKQQIMLWSNNEISKKHLLHIKWLLGGLNFRERQEYVKQVVELNEAIIEEEFFKYYLSLFKDEMDIFSSGGRDKQNKTHFKSFQLSFSRQMRIATLVITNQIIDAIDQCEIQKTNLVGLGQNLRADLWEVIRRYGDYYQQQIESLSPLIVDQMFANLTEKTTTQLSSCINTLEVRLVLPEKLHNDRNECINNLFIICDAIYADQIKLNDKKVIKTERHEFIKELFGSFMVHWIIDDNNQNCLKYSMTNHSWPTLAIFYDFINPQEHKKLGSFIITAKNKMSNQKMRRFSADQYQSHVELFIKIDSMVSCQVIYEKIVFQLQKEQSTQIETPDSKILQLLCAVAKCKSAFIFKSTIYELYKYGRTQYLPNIPRQKTSIQNLIGSFYQELFPQKIDICDQLTLLQNIEIESNASEYFLAVLESADSKNNLLEQELQRLRQENENLKSQTFNLNNDDKEFIQDKAEFAPVLVKAPMPVRDSSNIENLSQQYAGVENVTYKLAN